MCDDAETVAGAGTDVRRCSDALGPRKTFIGMHLLLEEGGRGKRKWPHTDQYEEGIA